MRRMPLPTSAVLAMALFFAGGFDQDLGRAYAQVECDGLHRMTPAPALEGTGENPISADHELRAVAKEKCENFCAFRRCAETPGTPCQLDGFPITSKPEIPAMRSSYARQQSREIKLVAELRYCPCACQPAARKVPEQCTQGHIIQPPHPVEGRGRGKGRARAEAFENADSVCQAFCAEIDCTATSELCGAVPPTTWEPRKPDCAASGESWTCKLNVTKCKCSCLLKR